MSHLANKKKKISIIKARHKIDISYDICLLFRLLLVFRIA